MWVVTNEINRPTLSRYNDIITSFFELIIDLSKDSEKIEKIEIHDFLETKFTEKDNLDKRLLKINKSKTDKITSLIKEIIKLDPNLLVEQFEIYKIQNIEISKNNYNIPQVKHPIQLVKIFKDYFYDKFFGTTWIWTELVGIEFNRGKFKTQFKEENKLYVCSYCDLESISNERNAWVEHFLPKNKFPYVSCNPSNLLPSCTACNVSGSGKGENVKNPILNQYNKQIGDELEFDLNKGKIKIKPNKNESIENFVELLNIRKRYSEESVNNSVLALLRINYDSAMYAKKINEFDEEIFIDFLQNIGRITGKYFVQKSLLKYIDEI
jgi:hypothetical protein